MIEYISNIKAKYPNTCIGLNAYYTQNTNDKLDFFSKYNTVPLDYFISLVVSYIEYRQINFLESLCNTQIDNVADNHQSLRMKTVAHILNRLEKHITPFEGQPF
jgi:hypothetical protein